MTIRRIKSELFRLGLHVKAGQVVTALKEKGIHVSADLVNRVKLELLKESSARRSDNDQLVRDPVRNRRRQKIPTKRPYR